MRPVDVAAESCHGRAVDHAPATRRSRRLLLAARCLRHTRYPSWAYKAYRRAAQLVPHDRAVAEEVGLFGAAALTTQYSRSWPMYLAVARADQSRRERIDPVLVPLARRLPAEASGLVAAVSLVAMTGGAWIVGADHDLTVMIGAKLRRFRRDQR